VEPPDLELVDTAVNVAVKAWMKRLFLVNAMLRERATKLSPKKYY